MPPRKHENVNGDVFTNAIVGKLKGDPDAKLACVQSLYKDTGHIKFDREYFEMMSTIYIASGLNKEEMDSISMVVKFITDELGNLRKVLMETVNFERKSVLDLVGFPNAE